MENSNSISNFFKKDSQGNTIFFPFGIFGRGVIIPDDQEEIKIKNFYSKLQLAYIIPLIFIILHRFVKGESIGIELYRFTKGQKIEIFDSLIKVQSLSILMFFITLLFIILIQIILVKINIKNFKASNERMGIKTPIENLAKKSNKLLKSLLIISIFFIILGIIAVLTSRHFSDILTSLLGTIFFGFGGIMFWLALKTKKQK